jgi:hypothetical protein
VTHFLGVLPEILGDRWAGAWIDNSASIVHVGIFSSTSRDKKQLRKELPQGYEVQVHDFRFSWHQLRLFQRRLEGELAELHSPNVVSIGIRADLNAVLVELSHHDARVVERLQRQVPIQALGTAVVGEVDSELIAEGASASSSGSIRTMTVALAIACVLILALVVWRVQSRSNSQLS